MGVLILSNEIVYIFGITANLSRDPHCDQ